MAAYISCNQFEPSQVLFSDTMQALLCINASHNCSTSLPEDFSKTYHSFCCFLFLSHGCNVHFVPSLSVYSWSLKRQTALQTSAAACLQVDDLQTVFEQLPLKNNWFTSYQSDRLLCKHFADVTKT